MEFNIIINEGITNCTGTIRLGSEIQEFNGKDVPEVLDKIKKAYELYLEERVFT